MRGGAQMEPLNPESTPEFVGVTRSTGRMHRTISLVRDRWRAGVWTPDRLLAEPLDTARLIDTVFAKSTHGRVVARLEELESFGVRVINSPERIRLAADRAAVGHLARSLDIPTPDQRVGPLEVIDFDRYVVKTRNRVFAITSAAEHERLKASLGERTEVYAERFVDAEWEHKLFIVGQEIFHYRQRPAGMTPDARSTRTLAGPNLELESWARALVEAVELDVAGVDFLDTTEGFVLTDLNSMPGIDRVEGGPRALKELIGPPPGRRGSTEHLLH